MHNIPVALFALACAGLYVWLVRDISRAYRRESIAADVRKRRASRRAALASILAEYDFLQIQMRATGNHSARAAYLDLMAAAQRNLTRHDLGTRRAIRSISRRRRAA